MPLILDGRSRPPFRAHSPTSPSLAPQLPLLTGGGPIQRRKSNGRLAIIPLHRVSSGFSKALDLHTQPLIQSLLESTTDLSVDAAVRRLTRYGLDHPNPPKNGPFILFFSRPGAACQRSRLPPSLHATWSPAGAPPSAELAYH